VTELRVSGYDRQIHAFELPQGDATWAALCQHSAPVDFLAKTLAQHPTCVECLIEFGHTVAARQERQRPAIAAGVRDELRAFDGDKHVR
jgi:hypothetical protein